MEFIALVDNSMSLTFYSDSLVHVHIGMSKLRPQGFNSLIDVRIKSPFGQGTP